MEQLYYKEDDLNYFELRLQMVDGMDGFIVWAIGTQELTRPIFEPELYDNFEEVTHL